MPNFRVFINVHSFIIEGKELRFFFIYLFFFFAVYFGETMPHLLALIPILTSYLYDPLFDQTKKFSENFEFFQKFQQIKGENWPEWCLR